MILTRNAADLLGVGANDEITVKTSALDEATVPITHVADNYLGNAAYLTQSAYEQLFDEEVQPNGFYLALSGATPKKRLRRRLAERNEFLSVSSTQQMNEEFSKSFDLINTIVYVIVFLAAALAFVVLFTLSTTNISERTRELATIKVLGFRKREVNHYVNKETVLLTIIGVVLGIPAGYAFSHMLTYVLKMPSIYFAVTIDPISYAYACGLTLLFAFIVAQLSNRALAKINMIEALKSHRIGTHVCEVSVLLMAHRLNLRQGLDFPRVARLLCRSVIDQAFIKDLAPESCQSCSLRLPLAKFAPFVLAVASVDFTAQMPYRTFLGRHWPNSRQSLSCSRFYRSCLGS